MLDYLKSLYGMFRYKPVILQALGQAVNRFGELLSEMNMILKEQLNTTPEGNYSSRFLVHLLILNDFSTLAMANKGKDTNGSQWYITFRETPHLDNKHTVFGKLVGGEEVLDALEQMPVKPKTDRPVKPVKITEIVM
jgi:cyclophilin family peptidyl-prolyl cis-trans isomerase